MKVNFKDKDYDLISVIYHASQGCETARQYAADAQRENDEEAAAFFNKALELNAQLVRRGRTYREAFVKCRRPSALRRHGWKSTVVW